MPLRRWDRAPRKEVDKVRVGSGRDDGFCEAVVRRPRASGPTAFTPFAAFRFGLQPPICVSPRSRSRWPLRMYSSSSFRTSSRVVVDFAVSMSGVGMTSPAPGA